MDDVIRVVSVRPVGDYKLALEFSDGTSGVADLSAELGRKAFAPLRDKSVFAEAFIDMGTVCWPGELDLAAERLYALAHDVPVPETLEDVERNEEQVSLRELRKELDITQAQLAEALEMTQGEVSRLEQRSDHKLSTLRRVVTALGGTVSIVAEVRGKKVTIAV